jgi:hypothetical protein
VAVQKSEVVRLKKVFLSDLDSWNKVLDEEASEWIRSIMSFYELDNNIIFGKDSGKATNYLVQNKIFIDSDLRDNSIKVSKDGQTVGEWKSVVIKTKIDEDGSPFAEISADIWSVKDNPKQTETKLKGKSK